MEIHRHEGPTKSLKDFLIHIVIVSDARENFRVELQGNRGNLDRESKNVRESLARVAQIVADLPSLRKNPAQFQARVAELSPSGYFFSTSRWEAALSMGALGHMSVDEVNEYAAANFLVHTYSSLEIQTNTDWHQLEAFVSAHDNPTPELMDTGVEKLLLYGADTRSLEHVGEELSAALDTALGRK